MATTMIFEIGFTYKGMQYGWYKKELYRLPTIKQGKCYAFRKMNVIAIGNKKGYRCVRDKFTIEQVKEMSNEFEQRIEIKFKQHKDMP